MTTRTNFTPEEWTLLKRAPMMAGLVVVAASPSGPLGALKESLAVGSMLRDSRAHPSSSELLAALAADLGSPEGRQSMDLSELVGKSPDQIKGHALEACRKVAALLDQKATPQERTAFVGWLDTVGRKVAEAAKEGGFLGFGGTAVSDQEKTALTDLRRSLGVAA
jgi:hypothetical protein